MAAAQKMRMERFRLVASSANDSRGCIKLRGEYSTCAIRLEAIAIQTGGTARPTETPANQPTKPQREQNSMADRKKEGKGPSHEAPSKGPYIAILVLPPYCQHQELLGTRGIATRGKDAAKSNLHDLASNNWCMWVSVRACAAWNHISPQSLSMARTYSMSQVPYISGHQQGGSSSLNTKSANNDPLRCAGAAWCCIRQYLEDSMGKRVQVLPPFGRLKFALK